MSQLETGVRVRAEGLGVTIKTLSTFALLYLGSSHKIPALVAFALGQLAYACTVLSIYVIHYGWTSFLPGFVSLVFGSVYQLIYLIDWRHLRASNFWKSTSVCPR
jgi:oligosaccharide translocation protein RFT1